MSAIPKEYWLKWLDGKTSREQAENIIGNLVGYRASSQHRAADTISLANAIDAIRENLGIGENEHH